jgi:hypothetical protein
MNNRKKITQFILLSFILFHPLTVYPQGISLDTKNQPLNSVLIGLRNNYGMQLSFNDRQLSRYTVSADTTFVDQEEALKCLLSKLPFALSRSGDVFIISSSNKQENIVKYLVSGQVRDRVSKESLPFSHILFRDKWLETDFLGQFSCQTQDQPPYNLKVSYLGYYGLDTLVNSGAGLILDLAPSDIPIEEVVIFGKNVEKSINSGRNTGEIKINHHIAQFLPGNGDNSVFNLLRLQPGICAAGELANDLIIWGSYEGQSRVLFDGFTIFGLKNFNDNISAVNPFLAKDIRVLKGGYGPEYGERVGGIVDITGVKGAMESPDVKLSLNNLTLNGYLSVPVAEKNSFVMAFRQTYYDLYESSRLSFFSRPGRNGTNPGKGVDLNVYPDYLFRDVNLKLSGETDKGDNWHLSLFTGSDRFSYIAEDETSLDYIYNSADEKNIQNGGALFYSKKWKRGSTTQATASYSGAFKSSKDVTEVKSPIDSNIIFNNENLRETYIDEVDIRIDHKQPLSGHHTLEFGGGVIFDKVKFREDTSGIEIVNSLVSTPIFQWYGTDIIHLGKRVILRPGVRVDYPFNISKLFFQPRISLTIDATDHIRINSSTGRYNQFMALNSVIDESGNYRYLWTVCDNDKIPVLSSNHYVTGISYSLNDFEISAEGYFKSTSGLTRYVNLRNERNIYEGKSRSIGFDVFVKKELNGSTFWISYSLSRTEEYFPYFISDNYRRALHDQLHEIKLAGIIDLEPFYLSGNWVYGSGFYVPNPFMNNIQSGKPYNRVDVSAVYRLSKKKYLFDAGISLLNVFNTENIKYSNFTRISVNVSSQFSIHAEAVPRTLTLFINFSF